MPRLSLWKPTKGNDFKFMDNRIREQFIIGGTGINIHKYMGPVNQGDLKKADQPMHTNNSVTNIQDLLFLENRDRKYEKDVTFMKGVYNVNDVDFDLSQFGLFLQNDTVFITFHMTDMVNVLGRKLLSGDVIELPHLKDDYALEDETVDKVYESLKRYYVIQDGSRAAEGFSQTWYPHLYRVKMKQIIDSQEFKEILDLPAEEGSANTLRDVLSTYEQEMQINNAIVQQAEADAPKSGYETQHLYTLQVDDEGKPELVTTDIDTLDASQAGLLADRVNQTPERSGYDGYLLGDGIAPNGEAFGHGIGFPTTQIKGDYFLRTDFLPNRLFRYDGGRWIKMEDSVRMTLTNTDTRATQKTGFINNSKTAQIAGETVTERQPLSKAVKPKADN